MNRIPPDEANTDIDDHYRRVTATDAGRPSDATRQAILAHARRVAGERKLLEGGAITDTNAEDGAAAGAGVESGARFGAHDVSVATSVDGGALAATVVKRRAPTFGGRRRLAYGSLAAAALAGLLITPMFLKRPAAPTPSARNESGNIAVPTDKPLPMTAPADSVAALLPSATQSGPSTDRTLAEPRGELNIQPAQLAESADALTGGAAGPHVAAEMRQAAPPSVAAETTDATAPRIAVDTSSAVARNLVAGTIGRAASSLATERDHAAVAGMAPDETGAAASNLAAKREQAAAPGMAADESGAARMSRALNPNPGSPPPTYLSRNAAEVPAAAAATARAGAVGAALRSAAAAGDMAALRTLLDTAGAIDSRDASGRTALMLATMNGHAEAVAALVMRGADSNLADIGGVTPLGFARAHHQQAIVRLLERGSK